MVTSSLMPLDLGWFWFWRLPFVSSLSIPIRGKSCLIGLLCLKFMSNHLIKFNGTISFDLFQIDICLWTSSWILILTSSVHISSTSLQVWWIHHQFLMTKNRHILPTYNTFHEASSHLRLHVIKLKCEIWNLNPLTYWIIKY